jgi:hypothetical protein
MKLMKNKTLWKLSLCMFILCGATCVKAKTWDWTKPFVGPGEKISTLIITGNYAKPRIIAELIQADTRQPILLTPAKGHDGIYFMPPQKDGGKAMKIPYNELTNFINFVGPKQILVLGDTNYVSNKYFSKISKEQTVCRISSKNWQRVADTVGDFLNIPNLPNDYQTLNKKMTNNVNYVRANNNDSAEMDILSPDSIEPLPAITPEAPKTDLDKNTPSNEPFIIDASQK